jgi:MYXO-CTERM domain-containing protein
VIWIALWGCAKEDEKPAAPAQQWHLMAHSLPKGPDDPVVVEVTWEDQGEYPASPDVRDASGDQVPMVPLYSGARLDGYVAEGGFAPGTYEVVGSLVYETVETVEFSVGPYGGASLDPNVLVGRAWTVVDADILPQGLDELVWEQLEDTELIVTIDAVTEEGVEFRVVIREPEFDCVGFRDRATLDETGRRLRWEEDEATLTLPAGEETRPLPMHDLWAELAWLDGDDGLAWGQARATGDLTHLGEVLGLSDPICSLSASFGIVCEPCEGAVDPVCLPARVVGGVLEETLEVPAPSGLPLCGVDRIDTELQWPDLPPLSCDFELDLDLDVDCGCRVVSAQAGLPLLLVGMLLAWRRRST